MTNRGENWSAAEVAATVADYMRMYSLELSGQRYNKSAHRKALLQLLNNRSDAAVELKHQNISAVLRDLGHFWIRGYKPRGNYQRSLAEYVAHWVEEHPEMDSVALAAADQPAAPPSLIDFSRLIVDAPSPLQRLQEPVSTYRVPGRRATKCDYVAREARNIALGTAGELLVLEYEEFRLKSAGREKLSRRIEHVTKTHGDGLGYDILSFELSGKERFIEVKTTSFAKETPFFASANEVGFARDTADQFHLYRLFDFRKTPKLFVLTGDIRTHCTLDPVSYLCLFQ